MLFKSLTIFKHIDWLLLVAVFLLISFGLASLYSLGLAADKVFTLLNKQIVFSILGLILVFVFAIFDYRWWKFLSPVLYLVTLILLILVLFFGQNLGGTTGWFLLGNFSFQPIELAKLAVIILLAFLFSRSVNNKQQLSVWLKTFMVVLPIAVLAILQPDFGSMLVILLVWFAMLCLQGIKRKQLLIFILILLVVAIISWQFVLLDYQKGRILSFIDPGRDPLGSGYNVRQSVIAVGSGNMWGRGLGLGTQSQLHFLPVSEADFIFAALAEELGLIGVSFIFILYFIIFHRLIKILKNSKDDFGLFLVFGLGAMFFIQLIINIGMTIGLLPVTGLPLPFVSYGGSFLIVSLVSLGIIQSVKARQV